MSVQLPEVTGEFGIEPTLSFPTDSAPDGLQVSILSEGDGEIVAVGDAIDVNYHGQIWGGGIFDSSFRRGQSIDFPIGVGMVIKGWDESLVGKKVGSRVLVSIPPEFGYGARGVPQAGIGGDDTLVFVVDLLGIKR
ncbi:FKBP-type peptidyl-prolyl cis-trans isomerase [Rarobacter faecitabidus]|uniref:Peptidyl-prolyl cis-trans isomerase n=1 Tax=Rarobacter faecitabidus TaxID=13243 RepID=A0A542ZU02_RARFA|nr:FKBP-type peptidyl-prolyl cis-trans isomerase [Rarobacter faecitabidus]TQL63831.1 peptidylprolyl isomerase [Rarobacter faecitabidus]